MTDATAAKDSGVAHGDLLVAFAEANVGGDDAALDGAREALRQAMGPEAVVDAAAVVGNFERMTRIADGTGIALDGPLAWTSGDVREELGLDAFGSSNETRPQSRWQRLAGRALAGTLAAGLRFAGRRRRRQA